MNVFLCTDPTLGFFHLDYSTSHKIRWLLLFFAIITVTWQFGCILKYLLLMTQYTLMDTSMFLNNRRKKDNGSHVLSLFVQTDYSGEQ